MESASRPLSRKHNIFKNSLRTFVFNHSGLLDIKKLLLKLQIVLKDSGGSRTSLKKQTMPPLSDHSQAIGCHSCASLGWDDGSWNKWLKSEGFTYYVCDACFISPKRQWRELFLLYEKADLGVLHLPQGFPTTKTELEHRHHSLICHQEHETHEFGISRTYQKTEQAYKYSHLNRSQIRLLDYSTWQRR